MNLMDVVKLDAIKVPLECADKRSCIRELVDVLATSGKVTDPESLFEAVWARETTRTTGIGHALAIPHGKCDSVSDLCLSIGVPAEPIDFQSIDDKPVRLVVLLASPTDRTSDHIQALARISRLMNDQAFREQMYGAESAETIYRLLQEQELAAKA